MASVEIMATSVSVSDRLLFGGDGSNSDDLVTGSVCIGHGKYFGGATLAKPGVCVGSGYKPVDSGQNLKHHFVCAATD